MPAGNSIVCQQGWICVEGACCRLGLEKHGVPQELWRVRKSPHPHSLSTKVPTYSTYRPATAGHAGHPFGQGSHWTNGLQKEKDWDFWAHTEELSDLTDSHPLSWA